MPRAVPGARVARRTVLLVTTGVVTVAIIAVGMVGLGGRSSATVSGGVAGVVVSGHAGPRTVSDPGADSGSGGDGSGGDGSGGDGDGGAEQGRVVGGQKATTSAAPWVVYLTDASGFQFCGGTLVTPTKVVTAAHCTASAPDRKTFVVVGRDDKQSQAGASVPVARTWVSPTFTAVGNGLDVSVLTLATPVEQKTLPLATAADSALYSPATAATIYGWGSTAENGTPSRFLLSATVPIRDDAYCKAGASNFDPGLLTCAGYDDGGVDTCQGDSGGPLVVADKLVGITSFGDGCARAGKPGYYTRVGPNNAIIAKQLT
ncbi:MAG TPA: serine protease [Actinomycetospora sp.]|uniref:S1 family peptidase n=1 Tax=Actinomycetospora sp. TaxID=1872135 RepID=UPI002F410F80